MTLNGFYGEQTRGAAFIQCKRINCFMLFTFTLAHHTLLSVRVRVCVCVYNIRMRQEKAHAMHIGTEWHHKTIIVNSYRLFQGHRKCRIPTFIVVF